MRQESSIAFGSTTHLYESFVNTSGPKQNISELPAWSGIVRSKRNRFLKSINRSRLILSLVARQPKLYPQHVISRTKRGSLLVFMDSFVEPVIPFQECGPNQVCFRIIGSESGSSIGGV